MRFFIWIASVLLVLVGITEIVYSTTLPEMAPGLSTSDLKALAREAPPRSGPERKVFFESWYERREAMEGGRYERLDAGLFDLTLGLLLVVAVSFGPAFARTKRAARLGREIVLIIAISISLVGYTMANAILESQRSRLNGSADTLIFPIIGAISVGWFIFVSLSIVTLIFHLTNRGRKPVYFPIAETNWWRALVGFVFALPIISYVVVEQFTFRLSSASWLILVASFGIVALVLSFAQTIMTVPVRAQS
ncbi:hypothetical protein [Notoacmeibacter sp. MSK16QG-6]|uniref:hypothetical protein n=1 Tax=Notoacmeibacter sp. MSK16QG-6 TaxID=2957982 RepID=UPI00209E1687|nr:hypothetical protein [Notoacmeibacter sp. MSK16QG-6]MCP1200191.1 hypothetical protein [Notoacmeibacter sp. MSK16QG-6]